MSATEAAEAQGHVQEQEAAEGDRSFAYGILAWPGFKACFLNSFCYTCQAVKMYDAIKNGPDYDPKGCQGCCRFHRLSSVCP